MLIFIGNTQGSWRNLILTAALLVNAAARAASVLPTTLDEQVGGADAVFRGTVVRVESFQSAADGLIYTRASLRVDEGFKGVLPPVINVVHRGGAVGHRGLSDSASPEFRVGEERLLLVSRRSDGTLFSLQGEATSPRLRRERSGALSPDHAGMFQRIRERTRAGRWPGADLRDQAASAPPGGFFLEPIGDTGGASTNGLIVDSNNIPSRLIQADRGEPIPYWVDAASLPAGISQAQALAAVSNAMSAWAAASSFKFSFAGLQNFGTSAVNVTNEDGAIRLQLHDNYQVITGTNTLGIGGAWRVARLLTNANWGTGGRVGGMEFHRVLNGYIILRHTNTAMQNLSTFTEVLTHEIGHVLGLAHSSNTPTNDPVLTDSIMFYLAHGDGRGAQLNGYDTNVVRLAHPLNTPPWTHHRVIDATTAPVTPNVAGINEVECRGYDLQSTNLTVATNKQSAINGAFTLAGAKIKFTPAGYFNDSDRDDPDPDTNYLQYFDIIYARVSDGTNASPYAMIRVISLRGEATATPDGIPDYWMQNYFGHAAPQAGDLSRATDDADGDRLNTLQEYIAGMNPKDAGSAQRITAVSPGAIQFQAKAYEVYEVLGSTNLANWSLVKTFVPANPSVAARTALPQTNIVATVSNLPTAGGRMFFRVLKTP